jgi:hypothetical protein
MRLRTSPVLILPALLAAALLVAGIRSDAAPEQPVAGRRDPAFFPIGVWLQSPANAARYRAAGINTYVGLWQGPTDAQLDALKAAGMKVVCEQNEAGLRRKADPMLLAWMHQDEPDNAQPKRGGGYGPPITPEKIVSDYRKLKQADPAHPVFLNLGQGVAWNDYIGRGVRRRHAEDYPEYLQGCDIASFDIYPAVHDDPAVAGNLWYVAQGVSRLREWAGPSRQVWNCIEASRIGNEKTKPTAAQVKAEVWMSIIHGSQGLIYFVHQFKPRFVEASLLQDAELLEAVTRINGRIRSLAPVINGPVPEKPAQVTSNAESPVAVTTRQAGDATYVFAVAMRDKGADARITLPGEPSGMAEVLDEERTIPLRQGEFSDHFEPYQVHLYRIGRRGSGAGVRSLMRAIGKARS